MQYLPDKVKSWRGSENKFIIEPKNANFSQIICVAQEISFGFGELKWDMSAVVPVVPKEEMNEEAKRIFRRLKGMECQLEWEGLGKRKPKFVLAPTLSDQRKFLPDLVVSPKIVNYLNKKTEVLDLLRTVKPDNILLALYIGFPEDSNHVFRIYQRYYENPQEITWIAIMRRAFLRGEMIRYRKLFLAIYDFFNETGSALRNLTLAERT